MKIFYLIFLILNALFFNVTVWALCNKESKPKLIKPIENWEIIASNLAHIKTSNYFQGNNLIYFLTYDKINPANSAVINPKTGEIRINAETRDNFDLTVNAQNSCGKAQNSFNVQIDMEE